MKKRTKYTFFISALTATLLYAIARTTLTIIYSVDYTVIEIIVSSALLCSELFMLMHSIGYGRHLIRSIDLRGPGEEKVMTLSFPAPAVAILVAARHEPKEVLEQTFRNITNIKYAPKNIYFLDDSSDEKYKKEAEEICEKFGINLFRRTERHGAKAGIINDCLKNLKEKYVAMFDADQNPVPSFLSSTIPILEADPKVAFVQTPQFFYNADENTNPIAYGATFQQSIFYEYICESKGISQSMFCCGSNVVFKTEALRSVNGFDEAFITEDFATSLRLHMNGWKSEYYRHVKAFGMAPEALSEYFKQQARWSRGSIGVLRQIIKSFIFRPFSMTPIQWIEYFLSGTYYFIGITFFILMLCPILYLLFNIPSFFIKSDLYFAIYLPYFCLSLSVFYTTLRARNYSIWNLFIGQMLSFITFPIYIKSAIMGLLGIQGSFGITLKGKSKALPYRYLWPQLTMMFANFIALIWGLNRFFYERNTAVLVNCVWVTYHFMIMFSIFYFNIEPKELNPIENKS